MSQPAPLLANATRDLARFAAQLRFEDIPVAVVDHAKLCLLDGLGVALFGAFLPWTAHVRDLAIAEGATPAASFWGTSHRGSVAQAALVNGTAGHAFEMDDIHKESIVHPNSLACPVALAFAEDDRAAAAKARIGDEFDDFIRLHFQRFAQLHVPAGGDVVVVPMGFALGGIGVDTLEKDGFGVGHGNSLRS